MGEFLYSIGQRAGNAPVIRKLGVLSDGMEETPIVRDGKLLLVESCVRKEEGKDVPYIRVRDPYTGASGEPFGKGLYFASGYEEGGVVYAFGTTAIDDRPMTYYQSEDSSAWHDPRGGDEVHMYCSSDLTTWRGGLALKVPGWRLWNTSVCKGPDGYVMAIEVRQIGDVFDPVIGHPFTCFFASSKDLQKWELMPVDCHYTRERYNACPALRCFGGYYYMICLEALPATRYASYIYRTKDFIDWEVGFQNPIMMYGDEDRLVHAKSSYKFSEKELDQLQNHININNSDVDLCEFEGKTHIFYATGDQQTYCFLAEAVYDGPLQRFCESYFE